LQELKDDPERWFNHPGFLDWLHEAVSPSL